MKNIKNQRKMDLGWDKPQEDRNQLTNLEKEHEAVPCFISHHKHILKEQRKLKPS